MRVNPKGQQAKTEQARQDAKDRIRSLCERYPGIEQRQLPRLLGRCSHFTREIVRELVAEGLVERRSKDSGVVALYAPGAAKQVKVAVPDRRMQCRVYRVPLSAAQGYGDTGLQVPDEFRVQDKPAGGGE